LTSTHAAFSDVALAAVDLGLELFTNFELILEKIFDPTAQSLDLSPRESSDRLLDFLDVTAHGKTLSQHCLILPTLVMNPARAMPSINSQLSTTGSPATAGRHRMPRIGTETALPPTLAF
jgi:hypothetical protein